MSFVFAWSQQKIWGTEDLLIFARTQTVKLRFLKQTYETYIIDNHFPTAYDLKGMCHEIFCFWFFSWISFPQASEYTITKFETISMEYSGAGGKLIHEKKPESKNLVTMSL